MSESQKKWIWQSAHWPPLSTDGVAVASAVARAHLEAAKLAAKADAIARRSPAGSTEPTLSERDIWTQDAVATSAIEGEFLDVAAVRSSVARRMGIANDFPSAVPRSVEGLLDVMEDAAVNWDADLTIERLCKWHAALFPLGQMQLREISPGKFRAQATPMQIVSGPLGRETVHYEAPPSTVVPAQMAVFVAWFNASRHDTKMDGLVRTALAHLWFESIHPFEDGNGRLGRAIMDLALSQNARQVFRLHGLSAELRRQQSAYYEALNGVQRGDAEPTAWVLWLIDALSNACAASMKVIDEAIQRAHFWAKHKEMHVSERQRKVLNKMLDAGPGQFAGGMTARKLQSIGNVGGATATRDLAELAEKGLLVRVGAGRSTRYELNIDGWMWQPDV